LNIVAGFVKARLGHVHIGSATANALGALEKGGVGHGDTEFAVGNAIIAGNGNRFSKSFNFECNAKTVLRFARHRGMTKKDGEIPPY
jgi:hypothetical protein